MEYDEITKHCEDLSYRDKLRLSQLLIQLARKEEEIQNPQKRNNIVEKKADTKQRLSQLQMSTQYNTLLNDWTSCAPPKRKPF